MRSKWERDEKWMKRGEEVSGVPVVRLRGSESVR